jgi:hypothetical protein
LVNRTVKENKRYPANWRLRKRGEKGKFVIWYQVPKSARLFWGQKSEVKLGEGATLQQAEKAAYTFWASRMASSHKPYTLKELFNRYTLQTIPKKEHQTQLSNLQSMKRLTSVFDLDQPVVEFRAAKLREYKEYISVAKSEKVYNLDHEVLSHIFSRAIEWGCEMTHPIIGIVKNFPLEDRERYVEDWEYDCLYSCANKLYKQYLPLRMATGKDKSVLLRIKLNDIKADGLFFPKRKKTKGHKGGKAQIMPFEYQGQSTGLREIINDILAWRKKWLKVESIFLFATSSGQPLVNKKGETSNFDSQFQRIRQKALDTTKLTESFQERDLRAKVASDVDTAEEAAQLLQHHSTATTKKVYRRKPETVLPIKR